MSNRFFPNHDTYIITSPFGPRGSGYHYGIDLVAKADGYGTVDYITAHTGGIVEECGYNTSAGYFIRIRVSGSTVMSYCHFRDKLLWEKGQKIEKGAVLGMMGSTGNSTGAHLHWGIKENGAWIDPAPFLNKDYTTPVAEKKEFSIGMHTLRQGDRGEAVRALQILLIGRGCDGDMHEPDGIFGPDTLGAVRLYQEIAGLEPDGIVGILTWSTILGVS